MAFLQRSSVQVNLLRMWWDPLISKVRYKHKCFQAYKLFGPVTAWLRVCTASIGPWHTDFDGNLQEQVQHMYSKEEYKTPSWCFRFLLSPPTTYLPHLGGHWCLPSPFPTSVRAPTRVSLVAQLCHFSTCSHTPFTRQLHVEKVADWVTTGMGWVLSLDKLARSDK